MRTTCRDQRGGIRLLPPDTTIHIAIVPRDPANDTIPDNEFLAYMIEVLPPFNLVCVIDKNGDPHFYAPNKKAPKGGGKK